KYRHQRLGHNSRLDALQAAILRVKLPKVDAWNERRRAVAAGYHDALQGAAHAETPPLLTLPDLRPEHVFHQFTVQVEPHLRPAFEHALREERVAFSRFYPFPLTHQPDGCAFDEAPAALALAERVVSLPIHPWLPPEAFARVKAAAERVACTVRPAPGRRSLEHAWHAAHPERHGYREPGAPRQKEPPCPYPATAPPIVCRRASRC